VHRLVLVLFVALGANAQIIRDAALLSPNDGWVLSDRLLVTSDAGSTWRDVTPPARPQAAFFLDRQTAWTVAAPPELEVSYTLDGGQTWTSNPIAFDLEFYSGNASIHFADRDHGWLLLQLASGSNFSVGVLFATSDGGRTWRQMAEPPAAGRVRFTTPRDGTIVGGPAGTQIFLTHDAGLTWQESGMASEETRGRDIARRHALRGAVTRESFTGAASGWMVVQQGVCTGFKTGCTQSSRLLRTADGGVTVHDITPTTRTLQPVETTTKASPSVVFTTHKGFDKCDAPSFSGLQDWWQNSPYKDLNIYIGGINRGCKTQANMTPDWIQQVSAMGWSFIPTWVGPQAPCTSSSKTNLISTDAASAAAQGVMEADSAAVTLDSLGLPRTIVYYDMERYTVPSGNTTCAPAVKAFLNSWMTQLRAHGVLAGAYGSPVNMAADWTTIPLDAIWFARWDHRETVWDDPALSNQFWVNHQRIHQYYNTDTTGGETWGSTQMFIDADIADAPLATATVNPDITPETGWWWNPVQSGIGFFLERNAAGRLFLTSFLYADTGRATWLLSNGAMSGSSYSGPLNLYSSGQTLTGSYRPNQLSGSAGTISLQFFDSTHATLSWPGGVIPIQRFVFGSTGLPSTPGAIQSGWWWNPDESGRGFALEVQNDSVFLGGFMYDDAGNPIWYLSTGGLSNPTTYSGSWAQYGSGQTLTGPIQANTLVNPNVGSLTLSFSDATHGTLTLPDGSQIPITRFQF
jgi:hypothetical protein